MPRRHRRARERSDGQRRRLAPLGDSPEVAEEKIEVFAMFTAREPTYLCSQMQTLRELAVSFGLTSARHSLHPDASFHGGAYINAYSRTRPAGQASRQP